MVQVLFRQFDVCPKKIESLKERANTVIEYVPNDECHPSLTVYGSCLTAVRRLGHRFTLLRYTHTCVNSSISSLSTDSKFDDDSRARGLKGERNVVNVDRDGESVNFVRF